MNSLDENPDSIGDIARYFKGDTRKSLVYFHKLNVPIDVIIERIAERFKERFKLGKDDHSGDVSEVVNTFLSYTRTSMKPVGRLDIDEEKRHECHLVVQVLRYTIAISRGEHFFNFGQFLESEERRHRR